MLAKLRSVFGVDDDFERALPPRYWLTDVLIAVLLTTITVSVLFTYRHLEETGLQSRLWPSVGSALLAGVLISLRRRFPVTIMLLTTGVHFIVAGILLPFVTMTISMQVLYFLALYTAIACARHRDILLLVTALVLVAMTIWLLLDGIFTQAQAAQVPLPILWLTTALINIAYFTTAILLGQLSWRHAQAQHQLRQSNEKVRQQAAQLAQQAVLKERLRIARDLHDSVAHYISLMGVQTAAARRAMEAKPAAAAEALHSVEEMSRNAVSELRAMLGSLRDEESLARPGDSLAALASLCEEATGNDLTVNFELVGSPELIDQLTPTQSGALLRITQEALTNVRRHSTAQQARVVVRLGSKTELEITDNGRALSASTGTGMGLVGIRERVLALGGTVLAGPRTTQGFRVLVQLPGKAAA